MPKFDIQQARRDGVSEEEIQRFLSEQRAKGIQLDTGEGLPVDNAVQPKKERTFVQQAADWLPLAGAVGGSFIPGLGTVVGGAVGAGAGALAKNLLDDKEGIDVTDIGKEALLGGVGGAVGKVAGGALKLGEKTIQGGAEAALGTGGKSIAERSAAAVLKANPARFQEAADAGVNVNKAFMKWSPKLGSSYDEMVGEAGSRTGGNIGKLIGSEEDVIDKTASLAGNNVRIGGDEVIQSLESELKTLQNQLGGGTKAKALAKIVEDAKAKYKKGVTVKQARTILKEANNNFGKAMAEDTPDAVASAAQVLEGKAMREALRSRFPTISEALDNEQELILLREILKHTQAAESVGGFKAGRIDFSRPGTIVDAIMNNPRVAKAVIQGNKLASKVNVPVVNGGLAGEVAGRGLAQGAVRLPFSGTQNGGNGPDNNAQDYTSNQEQSPNGQSSFDQNNSLPSGQDQSISQPLQIVNEGGNQYKVDGQGNAYSMDEQWKFDKQKNDWVENPDAPVSNLTSEDVLALMQEDYIQTGGKNITKLKTMLDAIDKVSGGGAKSNVSPLSAKDAGSIQAGLTNLQDVRQMLSQDPSLLTKQLIPGQFFSRKLDSALYDMADTLLRLRTGAQANPNEIRGYMRKIAPTFGDSPEVIKYKLNKLESDLRAYQESAGTAPGLDINSAVQSYAN